MSMPDKLTVHITADDMRPEFQQAIQDVLHKQHAEMLDMIAEQGKVIHLLLTRLDRLEALPGVAEALEAARGRA